MYRPFLLFRAKFGIKALIYKHIILPEVANLREDSAGGI
jgi:hypothetical protein